MPAESPATVADVHSCAEAMPHVTVWTGPRGNRVYQVGGRSFVFFRTPRSDAVDPETGDEVEVDTSDPRVRAAFAENVAAEDQARARALRRAGVDEIAVRTDRGYVQPLLGFFKARETRAARR